MQTQIISQIQQGTRKNKKGKKKKKANPDWTRNKEKQKEKKSLVKRSKKSMPLWAMKLLPLLHQITKIDLGICFGFCVWFCSWVFGAGSERELCGLQELVDFFFQRKKKRFKEEEEEDWFFGFWVCLHRWFLCFLGLSQHYQYMEFKF